MIKELEKKKKINWIQKICNYLNKQMKMNVCWSRKLVLKSIFGLELCTTNHLVCCNISFHPHTISLFFIYPNPSIVYPWFISTESHSILREHPWRIAVARPLPESVAPSSKNIVWGFCTFIYIAFLGSSHIHSLVFFHSRLPYEKNEKNISVEICENDMTPWQRI